jgi:hypothetical protein
MTSKPVVIKLACDSKEAQTNHFRSKLSGISKVYLENMFPEHYTDNQNIGPFKYRFRLLIFQINYSIDDNNYRLSHGFIYFFLTLSFSLSLSLSPSLALSLVDHCRNVCFNFHTYPQSGLPSKWGQFL